MRTPQGRAPFAFKLHQFISGPGKVLATLEPVGQRHITLDAQRFAPGRQTEGTQLYPFTSAEIAARSTTPSGAPERALPSSIHVRSTTYQARMTRTPATASCALHDQA
jgi:hypothetical protein